MIITLSEFFVVVSFSINFGDHIRSDIMMLRVLAQRSTLCRLSGLTRLPQIANRKSSTETYLAEIVSKKTEVLQKEAKSMEFAQKKLPLALEIDKLLSSKKRRDLDPFMNTTSRLVDKYEKGEITFEGEEKDLVASIAVMGQNAVLGPVVICELSSSSP